ncbi:hypothetical protein Rsub_03980 [Raphidocelis subcapitata]|uniref:Uncharacterized protein n=1 Tax=Raphidocelis subcapitata TaxID=307507 RepID=A0A2V0NVM1_9CHLO|nr:hypothetical protein Rsub_03980 [Raphidocelis subcapitata]|eukprot:GBF91676.1 hypothetical protein Rsub_03980 [Raphidocelis subcapitata]
MPPLDLTPRTAAVTSQLRALSNRRLCSSLALQQLLYYNVFWSAAWLVTHFVRIALRFRVGLAISDPDIVRTVLTVFWALAEPVRLGAGYYGNLQENVPWLVIFAALTLAPQTAVCYYMMLAQWYLTPFDQALQVVTAALLHSEFLVVLYAMARMLRLQRQQYYLFEAALQQQADAAQWRARQHPLLGGAAAAARCGLT